MNEHVLAIALAVFTSAFIGGLVGHLIGTRPKYLKCHDFDWMKVSKVPIPAIEQLILVYSPKANLYQHNTVWASQLSYNNIGKPKYGSYEITHWAYLPVPRKEEL